MINLNQYVLDQLGGDGKVSTGQTMPAINYSTTDPDKTLASIIERDWSRYQSDYVPVEDNAIGSLRDMSIIEDARKQVDDKSGIQRSVGRAERDAARYGFRLSNAQRQDATTNLQIDRAASDADTMNEARLNQFDRNRGFRNELINIGRGVSEQAQSGLSEAAGLKTGRDARNSQASAAASAQRWQMAGSLGALAILAL